MLDVIAKFTVHNTAEVRSIMHKEFLFEFRNELICFILQSSKSKSEAAVHLLNNFEFQSIAGHEGFRDSHGIHFLLRIFHESVNDAKYQKIVYRVLKNVFGGMEENKIFLKDFFGNEEVFKYFFQKSRGSFVQWYFQPGGGGRKFKDEIEMRLEKILAPLDAKLKVANEKFWTAQLARQKQLKSKAKSAINWTNFAELEQKRKVDEANSISSTEALLKILREERSKNS